MDYKIGTRGSGLALAQIELVKTALSKSCPEHSFEGVVIKTSGDRKQGTAQAGNGDKRDWMHDLELAVLSGEIDFTIHCGKDIPAVYSEETALATVLERPHPLDVFIGKFQSNGSRLRFSELPTGASVGTASLRRGAQLLRYRSDLRICEHRGNINTRLRKLDESNSLSGIILAEAGVRRLSDFKDLEFEALPPEIVLPAVNQGTLVGQFLSDRSDIRSILSTIQVLEVEEIFQAERACVEALDGDCHSAVGIYGVLRGESDITLTGRVLSVDGTNCLEETITGTRSDARSLGIALGDSLLQGGAHDLLCEASRRQQRCYAL